MATRRNSGKQRPAQEPARRPPRADADAALADLGADLLRRAEESQPALEAAWGELLAAWGVRGEPPDLRALRARIQQECGGGPGDNSFSREIVALREERRP
jgi:hypothetical protein